MILGMEELAARAGEMTLSAAFWAGIAVSVGLCAAIRLPIVVAYVLGAGNSRRQALALSVLLVLGLIAGTVLLGTAAAPTGDGSHRVLHADKHLFWGLGLALFAAGVLVSGLINPLLLPRWLRGVGECLVRVGWLGALLLGGGLSLVVTPACRGCGASLQALIEGGPSQDSLLLLVSFAAGQSAVAFGVAVLISVIRPDLVMWLRAQMCSVEQRTQLLAGNILMVLGLYLVIVG